VKNNVALYNLITILVLAASGCGGASLDTRWAGARGHGESNPFLTSLDSSSEFETCRAERREQRLTLLCDAGILTGTRCNAGTATTTVYYREAVQLICEQDDLREHATPPQPRRMSEADCTSLLASIPPDVAGDVAAPVAPSSVTDPYIMRILTMNPALWQDDHAFCMNATSSYGAPGYGGVTSGYGGYGGGFLPPTVGYVGGGVGGYAPAPVVGVR